MNSIQKRLATARRELNAGLIEREEEIDPCLTAMIARHHVLLVGPPGTGKSMLANAAVSLIGGTRFQILLTKFSTPEEVMGPVSLPALKAGRYLRIIERRLPACDVAFVDEIFKANSAILNTFLTIMNERLFDNDGERVACPLRLLIGASNEYPGTNGDGKELGALFDRFALRKTVRPIATERGLNRLLWDKTTGETPLSVSITPAELDQASADAAALHWTDAASEAFMRILKTAKAEGIIPGDRRMKIAIAIAKAFAYLNGNDEVKTDDLEILAHVLWDDPAEQPQKLAKIVGKIANPEGMRVNGLLMEAEQIISATDLKDLSATATACKKLGEVHAKLKETEGTKASLAAEHVAAEVKRIRLATVEAL